MDRPNEPQTERLAAMLDKKVRRKMPTPRESKVPSGRVAGNFLDRNTFTNIQHLRVIDTLL